MQLTKVSFRHLIAPIQSKLTVKNESVATYGLVAVSSGLGANTRQVQQHP